MYYDIQETQRSDPRPNPRLHLDILLANGLLEAIEGPIVLYRTTEKGRAKVLEHFREDREAHAASINFFA